MRLRVVTIGVAIGLVASLPGFAVPSPAAAQGACVTQTLAIPATATSPNLSAPEGIAIDSAGKIYVADPTTKTLFRFTSTGTQDLAITVPGTTTKAALPVAIAVDAAGNNIYTLDRANNLLDRFTRSATPPETWTQTLSVSDHSQQGFGIAVDTAGNIYDADATGKTLHKFNSAGTLTMTIPATAATPALFTPEGIAVDSSGNIFASDIGSHTLYEFTSAGTETLAIPSTAATPNLVSPQEITVDSAGNIYTADANIFPPAGRTLYRFDSTGSQTLAIPPTAASPNLVVPFGIAVDPTGNLYTTDNGTKTPATPNIKIYGFSPTGSPCQSQTIAFTSQAPVNAVVHGPLYTVSAKATSGVPVSFSIDGSATSVCAIAGARVSFTAVGTCVIDANQAGDGQYLAAPQVQQSFSVGKGSQAISFFGPGVGAVGGSDALSATASSGLEVVFSVDASSDPGVCNVSGPNGSTVNYTAVGNCLIDANQPGDANYLPAAQVQWGFAVVQGSQTITFTSAAPAAALVGGPAYTVSATASSGLAVSFSIDASAISVCSISGAVVNFIGPGTCVIDADQAGDANHAAAPQVQQAFGVAPAFGSVTTHGVAVIGQAAPGGGTFTNFAHPSSDTGGNVLFLGTTASDTGLYIFDSALRKVLRPGDVISGIGTVGAGWGAPALNEIDTVAAVNYGMTSGAATFDAVIHKSKGGTWTLAAKTGQAVPGCTGGPFTFKSFGAIAQNDANGVTFIATYVNAANVQHAGVFVKPSLQPVAAVVCDGDSLGTGEGRLNATTLGGVDGPSINEQGDVVLSPAVVVGGTNRNGSHGVYIKPNGTPIRPLVKVGDSGPPTIGGTVSDVTFANAGLNNQQIGLRLGLTSVGPNPATVVATKGILTGGAWTWCVATGQTAPNSGGTFNDFARPTLSDNGVLAFSARVGLTDSILTCNGGASQSLALQGDPRPSPPATNYGSLREASIGGEELSTRYSVAFQDVDSTTGIATGIYVAAPWAATYDTSNTPSSWVANQSQTYSVTVTNAGNQPWPAGGSNPVHLGVHFMNSSGTWLTDQRFTLPSDLAPGASATLTITVTPPSTTGNLVLEHQMVKESQFWFSQVGDVTVTNAPVTWAATYDTSMTPLSWVANQSQTYSVTVTNAGNQPWPAGGSNPVHLGVHFKTSSGTWLTDQRFTLPNDLAPGASATLTITVTAPSTKGNLVLEHKMVKESQFWFSQVGDVHVAVQ